MESKKQTRFQLLKSSKRIEKETHFIPRSIFSFEHLKSLKKNDEFDTVGVVFRVDKISPFIKHIFVTNENHSFLMIELKESETREIHWSVQQFECYSFLNLKFDKFDEKYDILCCSANECSVVTQTKFQNELSTLEKFVKSNKNELRNLEIKKI